MNVLFAPRRRVPDGSSAWNRHNIESIQTKKTIDITTTNVNKMSEYAMTHGQVLVLGRKLFEVKDLLEAASNMLNGSSVSCNYIGSLCKCLFSIDQDNESLVIDVSAHCHCLIDGCKTDTRSVSGHNTRTICSKHWKQITGEGMCISESHETYKVISDGKICHALRFGQTTTYAVRTTGSNARRISVPNGSAMRPTRRVNRGVKRVRVVDLDSLRAWFSTAVSSVNTDTVEDPEMIDPLRVVSDRAKMTKIYIQLGTRAVKDLCDVSGCHDGGTRFN